MIVRTPLPHSVVLAETFFPLQILPLHLFLLPFFRVCVLFLFRRQEKEKKCLHTFTLFFSLFLRPSLPRSPFFLSFLSFFFPSLIFFFSYLPSQCSFLLLFFSFSFSMIVFSIALFIFFFFFLSSLFSPSIHSPIV